MTSTKIFIQARDFLIANREDYEAAYAGFSWPHFETFNWAIDWFDVYASGNDRTALWIVDEEGGETKLSFAELSRRSSQLAAFLSRQGIERGDRILVMLPNVSAIWEIMLASMKLGAVIIPATTLLTPENLRDRLDRGRARLVITDRHGSDKFAGFEGDFGKILVGGRRHGWMSYEDAFAGPASFTPTGPTAPDDPMMLYFTSGTTSKPKLVLHTHQSYPVGHLSTMYWIGLKEGDLHWNISSPGWAKHAWSSFFAPWNAGATVFIFKYDRFDAKQALQMISEKGITSLCAPPTVWRLLFREDLASYPVKLRELVGAGEPMNPEIIDGVRKAWGITLRDGYGQTETTAQVGNSPGQPVKAGSMGRPMPGYSVTLLDLDGQPGAREGEIALSLSPRPSGLMAGYLDDPEKTDAVTKGGWYRTGDVATIDEDGYLWYVGRADDVFKSSDYRISPFELESALIEHEAVLEAAVVPSPDPLRLAVPKAYITLAAGFEPSRETARDLFHFLRGRLAPYMRIRRIEFVDDLPKTISGKIRRLELRKAEQERSQQARSRHEFWEDDV